MARWRFLPKSVLGLIFSCLTPRQVVLAHLASTHWRACAFWRSLSVARRGEWVVSMCEPRQVEALDLDDYADVQLDQFKALQRLQLRGGCACLETVRSVHRQLVSLEIVSVFTVHLPRLDQFAALHTLKIRGPIFRTGFPAIGSLKRLRSLWLDNLTCGDQDIAHLRGLTALTALHLMATTSGVSLEAFGKLLEAVGSRLRTLEVAAVELSDTSYVSAMCPSLRELIFEPQASTSFDRLASLQHLQTLRVDSLFTRMSGPWCANLQALQLVSVQATVDLRCIGAFTRLEELVLTSASLRDLQPLAGLRELRSLALIRNPLVDDSLLVVAGFSKLEELVLAKSFKLTDQALAHIAKLPLLRLLGLLALVKITNAGLAHLTQMPRLKDLCVHKCRRVTMKGMLPLRALKLACLVLDDKFKNHRDQLLLSTRVCTELPMQFERFFKVHSTCSESCC